MNYPTRSLSGLALVGTVIIAGCTGEYDADREAAKALGELNVLDENDLTELMLEVADPNEAANYFRKVLSENPERVDYKRGLGSSLLRARRPEEAVAVYKGMDEKGEAEPLDRLKYAEALIQVNEWQAAKSQLDKIPPTLENFDRYRLEALIADYQKQWERADSFYDTARSLTTRPAVIYNNWGISKLTRGDTKGAEDKFRQAVAQDPNFFSAKNNMAIARAKRGNYQLPVVPMTEVERAQLLHNVALQAIRNGDTDIARGLLEEAVDIHPQHFSEAADKLAALENTISR